MEARKRRGERGRASNKIGRPRHYVSRRPGRETRCEGESAAGFLCFEGLQWIVRGLIFLPHLQIALTLFGFYSAPIFSGGY